jgi:hypothetical protein
MGSQNPLRIKLRRDITFHIVLIRSKSWTRRRSKGSKPLKTVKSSKSEEIISSGGGATMAIGSK